MRTLWKMTWVELKLFLREPIGVFFTLAFPLLMLFLFGGIYGNEPVEMFGGRGSVDMSVPAYMAMIIGTIGMIGLPITLAAYREKGILRRYRATPLHPAVILFAHVLINLVIAAIGAVLLVIVGKLVYNLHLPAVPLELVLAFVFCCLSFCAVSFVLAGLLPRARTAQAVGMAIFYPMLFLSGASLPREILPETMRRIGDFLPLTYVVILLQNLWFGQGWNAIALVVLSAMLLVGSFVSVRTFRWE